MTLRLISRQVDDGQIVAVLIGFPIPSRSFGLADQLPIGLAQEFEHGDPIAGRRGGKSVLDDRGGLLIFPILEQRPGVGETLGSAASCAKCWPRKRKSHQREGGQEGLSHDIRVLLWRLRASRP
jgi:hypothetical protein